VRFGSYFSDDMSFDISFSVERALRQQLQRRACAAAELQRHALQ
jgi:hypothetical protein